MSDELRARVEATVKYWTDVCDRNGYTGGAAEDILSDLSTLLERTALARETDIALEPHQGKLCGCVSSLVCRLARRTIIEAALRRVQEGRP